MSLLEVDKINSYYGDSHILFDVSMRIEEHEVVALLGRNGAGKSTTMKSLMGMVDVKSGAIRHRGVEIQHLPPYSRAALGIQLVPEERRVFGSISVPMMMPGLVTVFLFQFVAIWNNFMLPYIMLGNDRLFPITVGLSGLLNQGASQPAMYTSVITGALLSILPLGALFLTLQRYWQVDLAAGAVKA
ncbi:MAG: ATP-binding cassette domain-containing protein [Rhizobiales bacterium]|nr:ATP-binding cassette domain-containing protein [Hyphomicrobiales bacterium]